MTGEQVFETIKLLGVAAPLVSILVYLLKQSNEERREITDKFLSTLDSTVKTNAEASAKIAASLAELNQTLRDGNQAAQTEHGRIMDFLREQTPRKV